ncbi:Adenylate and Guanylate cyclase catalytic domain-containing protein [Brevibacterium sandarakinum]|uniref:Adenylate and Guanylate cyclase catalytic domain-containing protein n=1 Tax=Brevibacterium sandarakinum TaxID=629680 RepID=A0A1H1LL97_BRESA|nr:adenylate/guanylate cyclase domain-containing protein [Brevibacterium sandarakinum]SDR75122.1 Adenylate and Guanylate cyclase catalytic domain-containing protein [Brevibacterium sandarakinum]
MTGVSDFTAQFDIVTGESLGEAAEDESTQGRSTEDPADSTDGTDATDDADATGGADAAQDSSRGPQTIPVITEEHIDASSTSDTPPAASAPPSVEGIEHGDEDLPPTSLMSTVPWAEDEDSSGETAGGDFSGGLHEDPRTAALQIIDEDDEDEDETVYETRSAAERLEEILLDGKRVLDRREAAKLGGISTVSARKMWRALGMSQTDGTEKAYTVSDAHALRMWAKPVADGLIDQGTALSLARAIGQTTDRLVVWQMETLVDFLTEEKGLTDPEARRDALQVVEDMVDPLQKMLTYSWRRNLAEVMGRLNVNVSDGLAMDNRQGWYDSSMPLARAVGFIDLVSYTRLSQKMEPRQLANLVQEFQGMAYNIVATGGGRVIKTVGDEVFFAAETPMGGAEIAMTLMERVTAAEDLPQARVGFVWGRVLSRLGDIFGSSVNLAARLTAVADPGTIFTDEDTARVLSASDSYVFERRESITLQGLGETGIGEMKRGTAARMQLDLDDDEN